MNKNGVVAVVVVVVAIVLIGLWAIRAGEGGRAGADCAAPPNMPLNVTHTLAGNKVTVRWDTRPATESVTAYLIEAATDRSQAPTVFVAPASASTFERDAPAATYFVRVAARNMCGTSDLSPEFVVTVP